MSIIYRNANGWIISHENYFPTIPVSMTEMTVVSSKCGHVDSKQLSHDHFRLNPDLFDIWLPFMSHRAKCRAKTVTSASKDKVNEAAGKQDHDCVHMVQSLSQPLIQAAKAKRLAFIHDESDKVKDKDNTLALQLAQDFYVQIESKETNESWAEFYGENNFDHGMSTILNGHTFIIPQQTKFHCRNIETIDRHLKGQAFDVIVLDPPWKNKNIRRRKRKQAEAGYQLLENCKIEEIPIATLANDGALVVVWCTNCKAHQEEVVQKFFPKWGLQFIHKWYWLKVTKKGQPVTEFHEPESTLKQPFETILIGRKCSNSKISIEDADLNPKVIVSIPSCIHSHKPPLVQVLESQFGINTKDLKCLELFARSLLPGWTSYGNQVLKLQSKHLYSQVKDVE